MSSEPLSQPFRQDLGVPNEQEVSVMLQNDLAQTTINDLSGVHHAEGICVVVDQLLARNKGEDTIKMMIREDNLTMIPAGPECHATVPCVECLLIRALARADEAVILRAAKK